MVKLEEMDLGHSKVTLLREDLVRIVIHDDYIIAAKESKEMTDSIGLLGGGKEMKVIIMAQELAQFDRTAREFSAGPDGNRFTKADALVVRNLAQRMIANFYIQFDRPIKPSKVFNSEEEAINWLDGL